MSQYTIVATFQVHPDNESKLAEILHDCAAYTLEEEPGCFRFEILQATDPDGRPIPGRLVTNELFESYEAVEAHRNSWRTPGRRAMIRELLIEPSRIEHSVMLAPESA